MRRQESNVPLTYETEPSKHAKRDMEPPLRAKSYLCPTANLPGSFPLLLTARQQYIEKLLSILPQASLAHALCASRVTRRYPARHRETIQGRAPSKQFARVTNRRLTTSPAGTRPSQSHVTRENSTSEIKSDSEPSANLDGSRGFDFLPSDVPPQCSSWGRCNLDCAGWTSTVPRDLTSRKQTKDKRNRTHAP
ncbi:hypothetical protein PHLGIDRAFT_367732 [Phlebiopsis gigantea 11061_1 CR5-6]|uniref:Uncharacterized protein n=1 Tax=Phlebiopsis gigantea (strain 11061_1 CR5-6) TaxID=745531 RepID=A0A0C3P2F3_PHLG1|nr:hypothetical protein PHLGIDRAFT_367732 [Phlebiopsis gigantea 11061_1 CR5-6]